MRIVDQDDRLDSSLDDRFESRLDQPLAIGACQPPNPEAPPEGWHEPLPSLQVVPVS